MRFCWLRGVWCRCLGFDGIDVIGLEETADSD